MIVATNEWIRQEVFDIEINIGLRWFKSIRDEFRHMWE